MCTIITVFFMGGSVVIGSPIQTNLWPKSCRPAATHREHTNNWPLDKYTFRFSPFHPCRWGSGWRPRTARWRGASPSCPPTAVAVSSAPTQSRPRSDLAERQKFYCKDQKNPATPHSDTKITTRRNCTYGHLKCSWNTYNKYTPVYPICTCRC